MTQLHRSARRRSPTTLALVVVALGVTACGSDDEDEARGTTPTPVTTASAGSAAPGATASVASATSTLGTILVDGRGRTLYMFAPDRQGASTCTGQCIATWPAVRGPVSAGAGVDGSMLGTVTRADDSTAQATYGKWPLYLYAGDSKPGDVNGQGINGVWFVVGTDGKPIQTSSGGASTTTTRAVTGNVPGY